MASGGGGAAAWQPQENGLREICGLLEQQMAPTPGDKSMIWKRLEHYSQFPDFNSYLSFIFARAQGISVEVRQAAGLLLKNNLRRAFNTMPPANQQYIKSDLLPCMGALDKQIRSTAGTIISTFVQIGGVAEWPELLHALVKCLDSNDVNHMEGAMDALSKICEDVPQILDSDITGLPERPINAFIPRFLQLFQSPNATLRKLSLGSVNQYIMLMPKVLFDSMDKYLQGLFVLANDPAPEVRMLVCAAFVQLIEVRPAFLEPHMRNVIEYMLLVNKDPDGEVALEACEFWSAYCEAELPSENLREFLPRLIPILLSNMVYADDDISIVDAEIEYVRMGKQQEDAYKEAIENYRAISQARIMKSSETSVHNVANILPRHQISNYFLEFRKIANHPLLVRSIYTNDDVVRFAKMLHLKGVFGYECTLKRVIEELKSYNDFSQVFFKNNKKAIKPASQNFQIFFQSPDLGIPARALTLQNPNPDLTLNDLKSSLFPTNPIPQGSFFFTLNGKPLSDSISLLRNHVLAPFSTLTLHLRFHGGGGDGGATGAESRDCYLNMYAVKKPDKVDPNEMRLSKCLNCSLSNEPLKHPVVLDKLGNLFNKEALVESLLKKNLPKEFWYIKGLKDMIPVELMEIPKAKEIGNVRFQCPITGLEFNGKNKFYAIKTCGHVMSAKGFKEVKSSACLICHKEFVESDKIVVNGTEEEVKELWEKVKEEKAKVKDNGKKSKKLKNVAENGNEVLVLSGTKHVIVGNGMQTDGKGSSKKFKAAMTAPANATKEVYASIFTSSKKSDFKETYSCRSLPLGRN